MAEKSQPKAINKPPVSSPSGAPAEGMPNPESVVAEATLVSPGGNKYRILKTTERDETDEQ